MRNGKARSIGTAVALGLAVLVAAPGMVLAAYTTLGGTLGIATIGNGWQRDVRVWNNATDPAANDNTSADLLYPGATGAALAVWKAARAWGSDNVLAGKNFDFDWQGTIPAFENANANIVSWGTLNCTGGILAYTETPIDDGWKILMCENWMWSDGPGTVPPGQFDIQGIATHELGHALGLGHSTVGCGSCGAAATMCATVCLEGVSERTIAPDDAAGLQALYGPPPLAKPVITGLAGSLAQGQTLLIDGSGFGPVVNVKFTALTSQNTGAIPGLVTGIPSNMTGTQLSVIVPAGAADGNVIVWDPSSGVTSNAFPIDVGGGPPPLPPVIGSVIPASVQAFPGTPVTLTGTGFTGAGLLHVAGTVLTPPLGFTVLSDTTITFTSPVPTVLGPSALSVTGPGGASAPAVLTYLDTIPPKLVAGAIAITALPFVWNFGAGSDDVVALIVSTSPATTTFGTPWQILSGFALLGQVVAPPVGIGSFMASLPPGLQGLSFWSQIGSIDQTSGTLSVSNITSTLILL